MARYLITGAAGFIGSWLARELVRRGETVRCFDNLSTGNLSNLEAIEDRIEFIPADIRNAKALDSACEDVDYIFHQAAIASVQASIEDPFGTSAVNLGGTINLIAAARKHGVKRIVFASSSAVYGNETTGAISESAPTHPLSPYAIHKLSSEQYLSNLSMQGEVETVSLRYFNVYGPNQSATSPYSGVIARFAQRMLIDPDCNTVIYGDGEQSRDFVYIADVVNANLLAMHAPAVAVSGRVFNIGTGRSTTIRHTFEEIACRTAYTGNPTFLQARPGDVRSSLASIEAARIALGYEPISSFDDGLMETVEWYRQQLLPASTHAKDEVVHTGSQHKARPMPSQDRHISPQAFAQAVERNELELFYQPILDISRSSIVGAEALLRWRRGNRLLTPAHFIHLAECQSLVAVVGTWVIDRACADTVGFQRELCRDLRMAVNIAPAQLQRLDLLKTVGDALTRSGLPYCCLDLEVTERTLVYDCATSQRNLKELRRLGIRIAVDDFGVGHSNMTYLYRFPVDSLKIDQSFVQHRGHARVLDGIVAFARTLGVKTVAEGVETQYQLDHVRCCGCDEAQGYLIGKPVPAHQLVSVVEQFEKPLRQLTEARERFLSLCIPHPYGVESLAASVE